MRLLRLIGFVSTLLVIAGAVLAWSELRRGFSARVEPSSLEVFLAETARKLALPQAYRDQRNPLPGSPENIQAGMEHFADHCATCHANDGSGQTLFGRGLNPKPPDMRQPETQNKSDGELYYITENGIRLTGMPAFGERPGTSDPQTWQLVHFIRHLPKLTDRELMTMSTLNPKTEQERQEEKEEQEFLQGGNPQTEGGNTHEH